VWHSCTKARTRSKHCAGQPSCCEDAEALSQPGPQLCTIRGNGLQPWTPLRQALAIEPDNTDALVDAAGRTARLGRRGEAVPRTNALYN